ncbi:MAG TPA: RNase adapter RapZ [Thermotogota bacterium]|nr:RNase adapter RapZ [Thermotogota bacterium]HRW93004.1 RNase adapter RapZ [Thermotogota bacterium]
MENKQTMDASTGLAIITGMSGAGKSSVIDVLEDFGFFCMDNVPPALFEQLVGLIRAERVEKSAFVVDIRTITRFGGVRSFLQSLQALEREGFPFHMVFLDAEDNVLLYRYQKTRRAHPLQGELSVQQAIDLERNTLKDLKERADFTINTSHMDMKELKEKIIAIIRDRGFQVPPMRVEVESFSYNRGIPTDANLVFDVRFLPNPYYYEELTALTGMDKKVQEYFASFSQVSEYFQRMLEICRCTISGFAGSGRNQLKVAVGCTGGKHRSVYLSEQLCQALQSEHIKVFLEHREQKMKKEFPVPGKQ